MTRNQRLHRRLRMEQRQAKRCVYRREQAVSKAKQEELIAINLSRRPAKDIANNFESKVFEKAPKLASCQVAFEAVKAIKRFARFFDLSTWKPKGKSATTQLNSLAEYLFADWPMPQILWSVFWDESSTSFRQAAVSIGRGCSLYSLCQRGVFPIALTKRQCHEVLQMPGKMSLMEAVRLVQIQGFGGDKLLFQQWWQMPEAKRYQSSVAESFWQSCLSWLVKQRKAADADQRLLSGKYLKDFFVWLRIQYQADKGFSLRKRSATKVLAEMQSWQKGQALLRLAQGLNLPESGFKELHWQQIPVSKVSNSSSVRMPPLKWRMKEILSKSDLYAEGEAMRHCVYSYKRQIPKGACSIWALSCNSEKCVTVELRNHTSSIVQVKGKANREPNTLEREALQFWAKQNDLYINLA